MNRPLHRALAVSFLTAAAVTAVPATAEAATGYDRCPPQRFCVFTGPNGTGAIGVFVTGDGNLADRVGPRGLDNDIDSVWNRRPGETWILTNDAGYRGGSTQVSPRAKANIDRPFRNRASSLKNVRA